MYNSIVLSSCLFGSVYMFSKSVEMINKSLLHLFTFQTPIFLKDKTTIFLVL